MGAGVLLVLGGIAVASYMSQRPDVSFTEARFKTNSERRAFVNRFLPAPLPEDAENIRFEMVEWMDWDLEGSAQLSPAALKTYADALGASVPGKHSYKIKGGHGHLTLAANGALAYFVQNDPPPMPSKP